MFRALAPEVHLGDGTVRRPYRDVIHTGDVCGVEQGVLVDRVLAALTSALTLDELADVIAPR